ncbi:MBL fold metallo-hydrolase [Chloroflexota bacterium]
MSVLASDDTISIERLQLGPWGTNAYILTCPQTGEIALFDTPAEPGRILAALGLNKLRYVLMTHDHPDHLGAYLEVRKTLGVPVAAHRADAAGLPAAPDILLEDGDVLYVGNLQIKALHTPGHTTGSLCFLTGKYLFSGDTIFPGGPGKTASSDDFRRIVQSITGNLFKLPDETVILPGHGDTTVLAKEKAAYTAFAARRHPADICGDVLWATS